MKRLNRKLNESPRYNDTAIQKLMALVEQYGKTCWTMGFTEGQDGDSKYAEKKSKQLLDDIKEHATPYMAYTAYDDKEEFEESDSDKSGWFNDLGELTPPDWAIDEFGIDPDKSPLPDECVRACSHSGRVDDDVSAWVDELKFDQNFPVELARRWLRGYGAWDEEELAKMDARELAEKTLWIFAGDISDGETYCTMNT